MSPHGSFLFFALETPCDQLQSRSLAFGYLERRKERPTNINVLVAQCQPLNGNVQNLVDPRNYSMLLLSRLSTAGSKLKVLQRVCSLLEPWNIDARLIAYLCPGDTKQANVAFHFGL